MIFVKLAVNVQGFAFQAPAVVWMDEQLSMIAFLLFFLRHPIRLDSEPQTSVD
jgi:hypothetical protein